MENIREILEKKMLILADGITEDEKQEAQRELGVSRPTLIKYLSGDIVKIETAMKLVDFFSPKVKARLEMLRGNEDNQLLQSIQENPQTTAAA